MDKVSSSEEICPYKDSTKEESSQSAKNCNNINNSSNSDPDNGSHSDFEKKKLKSRCMLFYLICTSMQVFQTIKSLSFTTLYKSLYYQLLPVNKFIFYSL